ncbi:MAG TPA: CopD family protein [Hydrogenophaga sp.]|nr:CopD family protein [Hydrogenophaga sp.]
MPWLKLLHISAVIVWCGTVLYLPLLLRHSAEHAPATGRTLRRWPRNVFIGVATPAALLAIGSGTAIFVADTLVTPWLIYKLAGVGLLVLGHGVCGMLVLRAEAGRLGACRYCHALTALLVVVLLAIAWLVLRKPV